MDSMLGGYEFDGEHEETPNSERGRRTRYSPHQILHLTGFFKKCTHPDPKQQEELSKEVGLESKQVKMWFQNKRIKLAAQAKRENNHVLYSENASIRSENLAMKARLENIICQTCNNSKEFREEYRKRNLRNLQAENERLKAVNECVRKAIAPFIGMFCTFPSPPSALATSLSEEKLLGRGRAYFDQEQMGSPMNFRSPYETSSRTEAMEKSLMLETAAAAMQELLDLLQVNEPLWIKSLTDGRYFLDHDIYSKHYPKTDNSNNSGAWIESSKDSTIVPMPAAQLIEIFSDSKTWMDIFPTIVTNARTMEAIDTGSLGGSLHLMYAKLHILSPLVEPREYIFLRYSRQHGPHTWVIVDTSYNCFNRYQDVSLASWKLPSGCKIQQLPDGKSEVTWIEHTKVDGKSFNDLFKDIIWTCQAFGAKRWLATLERMCTRLQFSAISSTMTINAFGGVTGSNDGIKSLMNLAHKMVKIFCESLSPKESTGVKRLKTNDIQISVSEQIGSTQPSGVAVCMATSLWLPIPCKDLFHFLKDEKSRSQWDILFGGTLLTEFGCIATGVLRENCINLLKPSFPEESAMTIFQESYLDPLGGLIVYSLVPTGAIGSAIKGEDVSDVPILPSGFLISGCGQRPLREDGASTSSNINRTGGSILTAVFHVLMEDTTSEVLSEEKTDALRSFMGDTIAKMRAAMRCPNFI